MLHLGFEPDSEPVNSVSGRGGGYVFDFVFPFPDLHGAAVVGVDEQIVAKGAHAEEESAKAVEGEDKSCEERGGEISSRAEDDEGEQQNLDVHECHEKAGHEKEPEPVPEEESTEKVDSKPVEKNSDDFLQEVGF